MIGIDALINLILFFDKCTIFIGTLIISLYSVTVIHSYNLYQWMTVITYKNNTCDDNKGHCYIFEFVIFVFVSKLHVFPQYLSECQKASLVLLS